MRCIQTAIIRNLGLSIDEWSEPWEGQDTMSVCVYSEHVHAHEHVEARERVINAFYALS